MGATLELAFIGSFSVGASIPPDVVTGGILGTALLLQLEPVQKPRFTRFADCYVDIDIENIYLGL